VGERGDEKADKGGKELIKVILPLLLLLKFEPSFMKRVKGKRIRGVFIPSVLLDKLRPSYNYRIPKQKGIHQKRGEI